MAVRIEKRDENYLSISFDYSYEKVSEIKRIAGSRWDPIKSSWLVPISNEALDAIAMTFCDEDIIFDSSIDLFDR